MNVNNKEYRIQTINALWQFNAQDIENHCFTQSGLPEKYYRIYNEGSEKAIISFKKQNPKKNSEWAKYACKGHRVLQVIFADNRTPFRYLGVIINGRYYDYSEPNLLQIIKQDIFKDEKELV